MRPYSLLLFLFLAFSASSVNAQYLQADWSVQTSPFDSLTSEVHDLVVDDFGNMFVTGRFIDSVDMDPGPGTYYLVSADLSYNWYVAKYWPSGALAWAHSFGDQGGELGTALSVDPAGNVVCVGLFHGTIDFGWGASSFILSSSGAASNNNAFIQKLDSSGNLLWAKNIPSNFGSVEGNAVVMNSLGEVFTIGTFSQTIDLDPGPGTHYATAVGYYDIFVSKLDASGNFVFGYTVGGSTNNRPGAITLDPDGNVIITGTVGSPADFDPGPGTVSLGAQGATRVFVWKLSTSGSFIWAKGFEGTGNGGDLPNDIATDATGAVYTVGKFFGTTDFDPSAGVSNLTTQGNADMFFHKLDSAGNFVWVKAFQGTGLDDLRRISLLGSSIYLAGSFAQTVDFDLGPGTHILSTGSYSDVAFIGRYDISGNLGWVDTIGTSTSAFYLRAMQAHANGGVFVGGYFSNVVDFEAGPGTFVLSPAYNTVREGLALRYINYDSCATLVMSSVADTVCLGDTYTFPDGYITSSVSAVTNHISLLQTVVGCDSMVTTVVTPTVVDTNVVQSGQSLFAQATNVSYQWLDCNNGMSPILGETSSVFNPVTSGSYAVMVTNGNCSAVSNCHTTTVAVNIDDAQAGLVLYPNPGNGILHVTMSTPMDQWEVRNALGQGIQQGIASGVDQGIDLSGQPQGVYWIRVQSAGVWHTRTFSLMLH